MTNTRVTKWIPWNQARFHPLQLDALPTGDLILLNATSIQGQFDIVSLQLANQRPCDSVTGTVSYSSGAATLTNVVLQDNCGLPTGAIAGIAAGAVVVALLAVALPLGIRRHRLTHKSTGVT